MAEKREIEEKAEKTTQNVENDGMLRILWITIFRPGLKVNIF